MRALGQERRISQAGERLPTVVHVIDNLDAGGAQHIIAAIVQGSAESLVCALHAEAGNSEFSAGFPSLKVLSPRKHAFLRIVSGLRRLILHHRSSAMFIAHLDASTLLMCLLRKVIDFELVVTVHATQAQWPAWYRAAFRKVIFYADHVIVESKRALEEARALGLAESRLTLIPIGTSNRPTKLDGPRRDVRAELGIEKHAPILLNVARMVPGKGQIHLVRAMAEVPGAVAVIVGTGPEEQRLREETAALSLAGKVFFAGMRTDLHNFYSAASAFVMPCLDESMGIVIYDALTFRLPVVAYASGSIGEIVTDGENGYLVEPCKEKLAAALRRIIGKETDFRFRDPEQYSADTMVSRHKALYARLRRQEGGSPSGQGNA